MKKIVKKENITKGSSVLLIVLVLLFSNLSAIANDAIDMSTQPIQTNKSSYVSSPIFDRGNGIILEEDFADGNMPPTGDWGNWTLIQTNPDETWYIDATYYCASVHRGDTLELQDEWLITPSLDFSDHTEIYLRFRWHTDYYVAVCMDYIDLNVSISTDGGSTWTLIWTEDDVGYFESCTWYDTNVDLSAYSGYTNVKIGFQYYSNDTEEAACQKFSIDDVIVYALSDFWCDAGGPYVWSWAMQFNYIPPGVRFHGSAGGGELPYNNWSWGFGDGNTSTFPYSPIHFYEIPGLYNVSLTVRDSSGHIAFNQTTVYLNGIQLLEILIKSPSIGIKAKVKNPGEGSASYVNWTMVVHWGPLQIFEKMVGNGIIERIAPESSEEIRSGLYFFGFGRIHIVILAEPENIPGVIKHFDAFKIGPFVFGAQ